MAVGALLPGLTVPVRVDPNNLSRLAIDFAQLIPGAGAFLSGQLTAEQVIAVGMAGSGVIQQTFRASPPTAPNGDPVIGLLMSVTWIDGRLSTSRNGQRVPRDLAALVVAGATFPVKGDPSVVDLVVIDWPSVRLQTSPKN